MTFKTFEGIVKEHRPEIQVFQHGDFRGSRKSAINVAVMFHPPHGKVYNYTGSYCYVLNRLGIKAIYRSELTTLQEYLKRLKDEHGKVSAFWGDIIVDNSEEIKRREEELARLEREFIIIE